MGLNFENTTPVLYKWTLQNKSNLYTKDNAPRCVKIDLQDKNSLPTRDDGHDLSVENFHCSYLTRLPVLLQLTLQGVVSILFWKSEALSQFHPVLLGEVDGKMLR